MNEFKGRPAPWTYDIESDKDRIVVYVDNGIQPHVCYTTDCSVIDEANAKLIASAPKLLIALQNLVKWEAGTVNHVQAYKDAQLAIEEAL